MSDALSKRLRNSNLIKFVRVAGEYRFCTPDQNHSSLVGEGEKALSAGTLSIYPGGRFKISDRWSMTLKVGADEYDHQRLALTLGMVYVEDFD